MGFKFSWNLPVNIYLTVWFYYFHLRSLFLVSSNLFFILKRKVNVLPGVGGGEERCMSWKPCKNLTVRFGKFLPISARSRNTIYARIIRAEFLSSHRAMIWICKKGVYTPVFPSCTLHSAHTVGWLNILQRNEDGLKNMCFNFVVSFYGLYDFLQVIYLNSLKHFFPTQFDLKKSSEFHM